MKIIPACFLLLLAYGIAMVIFPIGFLYTLIKIPFKDKKFLRYKNFLLLVAYCLDQFGNVIGAYLFNDTLVKRKGFGNPDETISSVLGKNQNNLTIVGKWLNSFLNWIDPGHSVKAIEKVKNSLWF